MSKLVKVRLMIGIMCACLLAGAIPVNVYAENSLSEELLISQGIEKEILAPVDIGAVTLEDFLWPNENGQYTYTYYGAEDGNKYMLMAVPGIHGSVSDLSKDQLISNLIYIDQMTAEGNEVNFGEFRLAQDTNCTVIVSGEGMDPHMEHTYWNLRKTVIKR